ncbi:hypothetical protein BDF21DRAFT_377473 [Thamnidium elegans]|nr:hypothetical protein BDF21DRAFT_377473 [Thamnidium elegans]
MKAWNYISGLTNFSLPNNIQKRLYKFLLRKAIGQFLEKELDLENFDIGIMNGSVELRDLDLNLNTLNKLLNDTPFVLEEGRVGCIHASIPWTTLWSGDISLKIQGLHLALRPVKNKPKNNDTSPPTPILEEPILSSSLHFADDFLKSEIEQDQTQELHESIQKSFHTSTEDVDMEGLQVLTKVIDKMLAKIKVDIIDTLIRISHKSAVPLLSGDNSEREYHIDICIPRVSYYDETPEFSNPVEQQDMSESSILLPANETIKFITFTSPEVWLNSSTNMYSLHSQSETTINQDIEESLSQTEFFDTNSSIFSNIDSSGSITPKASQPYKALLFTTMNKRNHIRLKLRPSLDDTSSLPIKQVDFLLTHMRATITPLQVAFFMDLMDSMSFEKADDAMDKPIINNTDTLLDDLNSFQPNYSPFIADNHVQQQQQQQQQQQHPDRKIKISLSLIELFILSDDQHVTDWNIPFDNRNHIKFAVEQAQMRIQQFSQGNTNLDAKIANVILAEWIKKPKGSKKVVDRTRTQYETYNPILLFDSKIKYYYRDDELFPIYDPKQPIRDEQSSEVIRVKFERKQSHEKSRFIEVPFDQDTVVDIQPFKLQIDPRIIDRFDNFVYAINDLNRRKEEERQQFSYNTSHHERRPSVFDDLKSQENTVNQKVRVRCAFIRVLLFVPDMSQTSTRTEFNDRFHKSQLSIDIKKLAATWSNTDQPLLAEKFVAKDKKPTKVNLELNYVNVFLQQDHFAETWFTAKTSQGKKVFSEGALCPTVEITIQDSNKSGPNASSRRSTYFGAGTDIPSNLFDFLNRNENFDAEQKLHIPMEDQSESAMIFKQDTIENSMFVINCHLPQTHMHLTKPIWDKVQIIQNDLLLWQPKFLLKQQQMEDLSSSIHSSSMMSQSYERLAYYPRHDQQITISKTLFSIVAVLSTGVWDIHTSDINNYRLKFSEFRYFAAMKYLGQNENMTTLDIEELDFTDISNLSKPTSLIYKTLPKTVNPKKDTSMVSLFSRLTSYPETNRIEKITSIVACNICWKATLNIDFIDHLMDFQKVPQEMVFIDPPTQYIKIFAHVLETSIDYKPTQSPSRAVVVLDGAQVITNILAGQSFIDIKTCIQSIELGLIDDIKDLTSYDRLKGKTSDARKYWSALGFVNILSLLNVELQVKLKLNEHAMGPQADVSIISTDIGIDSNTDSFHTLLNFITFCTNQGDTAKTVPEKKKKKKEHHRPHQINTKAGNDLLSSLDENAFRTSPTSSKISPPTLIEAPEMEEFSYVEEFYKVGSEPVSSSIFINHVKPPTKPRRKHRVRSAEDIIRVLVSPDEEEAEQFQLVDDYFGIEKKVSEPKSTVDINKAILSLRVSNINLVWKLYDGYAWDYIRSEMATKSQDGFGPEEKKDDDVYIEIKLDCISIDFDLMPTKDNTSLYFHLKIKDVEIIDNIKTSNWKKFLGYMRPPLKEKPRELDACMVDLELISLRPVLNDPQQEFRLKTKILPIRLYIDHDALNFLVKYFTFEKSFLRSTYAANQSINKNNRFNKQDEEDEDEDDEDDEDDDKEMGMFFQYVDIYPITLKVDYKPKYFNYGNIKEGQLAELVNLFHLDGAEMNLTHVKLTGIKGMDGLLERLGEEWLPHIKNTQVTSMVSGVSPIRSIVNLSTGVADLVLLPIQQYRKDGRLIKGIQRGTSSFARATAIEAIKLSSRVATGTQVILEHADGFFSPSATDTTTQLLQDQHFVYTDIYGADIPSDDTMIEEEEARRSRRPSISHSPSDISEGIQFAYQNLSSAAQTIFAVPTEEDDDYPKSTSSTTKSVIRAVPVAVIKPMIGLTGAFQSILTGLRNSIDPVMRLQSEDKYKKRK